MGQLIRFGDPDAPLYEFSTRGNNIVSITDKKNVNLIGEELTIDTLTPLVRFTVIHPEPLIDSEGVPLIDSEGVPLVGYGTGDLRLLPHGTKVSLYEVHGDEEALQGVFYVDNVKRMAKDQYQINCMSIIGLLAERTFIGRRFPNNTIPDVISAILDDIVPNLIVFSPFIASQRVHNAFIPNCTRRDALYHLMLSYGIGIMADKNYLYFRPVGEIGNVEAIPDSRFYLGGNVEYPSPPSSVQITAHDWDFYASAAEDREEHVVFDNTGSLIPASGELVTVDFLYTAYRIESISDSEYPILVTEFDTGAANYTLSPGQFRVLSGIGKLVLISPPRNDTIYELTNPDAEVERVISVTDELMISSYNAPNVARRLMDYYKNGRIITADLIPEKEYCGFAYELNNAFGEHEDMAIMAEMNTVYSSVNKATCRLVAGTNPAIDFPYSHYQRYTESQTIDLTEIKAQGVNKIAVLLVGGGQAGFDGEDGGEADAEMGADFIRRGGKGGKRGEGGKGGKTKLVEIDISDIDEITLTVGAGGEENGEEGEETVLEYEDTSGLFPIIEEVSTADGTQMSVGTMVPLSGEACGAKGTDGVSAGDGGNSGRIFAAKILDPDLWYSGGATDAQGFPLDISETVAAQPGGKPKAGNSAGASFEGQPSQGNYGTNLIMHQGSTDKFDVYYSFGGAGGGGAAYNSFATSGEAEYS